MIILPVFICILIIMSACLSAAEVALFALSPKEMEELRSKYPSSAEKVGELLGRPKMLLATLLIGINLVNISTIIASTFLFQALFDFSARPLLGFMIQVVGVTFILLMLGEVIPKVYSNFRAVQVAHRLVIVVVILEKIFYPLSRLLLYSSWLTERLVKKQPRSLSVEELSEALELTTNKETPETEKKLLRGIVRFGKMDVKQIMKPRPEMVCADQAFDFHQLLKFILSSGFSRMPVYNGTVDKIVGILYIKDLLGHLEREASFDWRPLVREPFFIPESKMIDDLLREFQGKKIHMAIIVDEYGGTTGLVTLEDIIEEIVGEINDEFDVEDIVYSKLDDKNFVFEGRVQLNDMCRLLNLESDLFDERKGDSDTLAGFLLEHTGRIPKKGETLEYKKLSFSIESADNRKIKRIKVTLPA